MNIEAKKIPTEPGCLVQRVLVPRDNFEARSLAEHRTLWRLTLWYEGKAWTAVHTSPEQPDLTTCMHLHIVAPYAWATLTAKTPA